MDIDTIVDDVLISHGYDGATDLCRIMKECGSDKGLGWHNYTTLYSPLLAHLKNKADVSIFEVGIGTNNPALESSMGVDGVPGASLYGWSQWLPDASVVGADIDRDILFNTDKITTYFVDQRNSQTIKAMWEKPALSNASFDVIIDDGLHSFEANDLFLSQSHNKLKESGIFIVEDILPEEMHLFRSAVPKYLQWFKQARVVRLPNRNNCNDDNNLLILAK